MKRKLLLSTGIYCLCILFSSVRAQEVSLDKTSPTGILVIQFYGLADDNGKIMATLHNSPETFLKKDVKPFRTSALASNDRQSVWKVKKLPFGTYAISVFQDRNGNKKLDFGLFWRPKEPTGFSNNFRPRIGPPAFEKAAFEFKEDNQLIQIAVIK
jgi:uncharacterized protein (DUF2141 family)